MNGVKAMRRHKKGTRAATGTENEGKEKGEHKRIVQAVKLEQK